VTFNRSHFSVYFRASDEQAVSDCIFKPIFDDLGDRWKGQEVSGMAAVIYSLAPRVMAPEGPS
jgi:hypothetical protein